MISNRRIRKLRRWERVVCRLEKRPYREPNKTEAAWEAGLSAARRHAGGLFRDAFMLRDAL